MASFPVIMNVSEPIRRYARTTPHAPAFVTRAGQVVNYAQLERAIDVVARRARALGLAPGQCAALATPYLYRQLVVALGLARAGIAHGPAYLPDRFTAVAIVDHDAQYGGGARVLPVDDLWLESAGDHAPFELHDEGDAPYMYCPTSGTTSVPKFVPITHAMSLTRSRARVPTVAAVGGGRGLAAVRLASLVGPGTSYGFSSALLALHGGGAVVEPTFVAPEIPAWFARTGVNYLIASPIALQKVLNALPPGRIASSLEIVEIGGGPLPRPVYDEACARLTASLTMNYGLTECGRVASAPMREVQERLGGVGYAYPGIELRVVDEDGRTLPAGQEGLLCVKSASSASGYLDSPAAAAQVFRDGWVYPGDRAIVEADGFLRVLGRNDDVINRGGVKVHPQAIEDAMLTLGDVQEVAVFAVEHGGGLPAVCAAVVPGSTIDADAYHQRCRERLGANAPALIVHVRELPRNAMGKVQRAELAAAVLEVERRRAKAS